jgi:hypothetical protein
MCETRWCIRANALATFKAAFSVIVSNLGYLQTNGDANFCNLTLFCHSWFTVIFSTLLFGLRQC